MNAKEASEVLGVEPDADEKTVRRAYAKMGKTYRPDTHPEEFSRIRKAYDALLNLLNNNDYQDPSLPSRPNLNASSIQELLPPRHIVSYVSDELGYKEVSTGPSSDDEVQTAAVNNTDSETATRVVNDSTTMSDSHVIIGSDLDNVVDFNTYVKKNTNANYGRQLEGTAQQSYRNNTEVNPLQSIEDALIDAIKVVKPGQLDSEEKVISLVDEYLAASNHHARELRDYVERFLVSTCLGKSYLPHVVRERVADFSGLSSVVLREERLQPWEQEFLTRFEESEQVEELIAQAGSKRNDAEYALVHDVSWTKALMLRLDENKTNLINRWMNYTYRAYGETDSFIHPGFQKKWTRLQQVEPLDTFLIISFIALMVVSGLALEALGVPLQHFFQAPTGSMLQMAAGLAVLSWANLILVQLARPVLRSYIARVRDWVFSVGPIRLLAVEVTAVFLLIWGWVLDGVVLSAVSTTLVVGSGCVLILVGVFARQWLWVNQLSIAFIVIRFLLYFYVAVNFLDNLIRTDATTSSLWLVVGLVVWVAPPRLFFEWAESHKQKPESVISLRYTKLSFSTQYPRWFIAGVAMTCLIVSTGLLFVNVPSFISPVVFGVLLTVLAVELAISGGFHADSHHSMVRYAVAWGLFVMTTMIQGAVEPRYTDFIAHLGLTLFLVWSAAYWLSPRVRVKIQG